MPGENEKHGEGALHLATPTLTWRHCLGKNSAQLIAHGKCSADTDCNGPGPSTVAPATGKSWG